MKFIIFNITVAATLVYLVAGDDLGLTSTPEEQMEVSQIEEVAFPVEEQQQNLTLDEVRPIIDEMIQSAEQANEAALSKEEIKQIVTTAIEDAMATQLSNVATNATQQETLQQSASFEMPAEDTYEEPLEEFVVETPVTHAPPVETGGLARPKPTDIETELAMNAGISTQANATQAPIQLAEGESLMTPKTRQKELDKLVSSLELMFLDKAN